MWLRACLQREARHNPVACCTHVGRVQQAAGSELMWWHKDRQLIVVGQAALSAPAWHHNRLGAAACDHARWKGGAGVAVAAAVAGH